jgi:hypothetical protein
MARRHSRPEDFQLVLKKDGSISQGRGSAMDAIKNKIGDDLPDKLTKTVTSYHDAAQAYSDYLPRLREAEVPAERRPIRLDVLPDQVTYEDR